MDRLLRLPFARFDITIPLIAGTIILIGLSTIQSTIVAGSASNPILTESLINIQLLAISFGLLLFFALLFIDYRVFYYGSIASYVLVVLLLLSVFFFAEPTRGSLRWIQVGSVNIQPSSIAVVVLITCFASFFQYAGLRINDIRYLAAMAILVAIPTVLIAIEPDLGSALVLVGIWVVMLHMSPVKFSHLLVMYAVILLMLPVGWGFLEQYQQDRVTTFMNPSTDPLGTGYNVQQAITAVGSGQLRGRGWGQGTQSHLQYLPEQHTDFIFATFAEEHGFIGVVLLLLLYGALWWRIAVSVKKIESMYGKLVVIGILVWFVIHISINVGMNVGIAPITGIPLPFMSYGGTTMVVTIVALGLIEGLLVTGQDVRT